MSNISIKLTPESQKLLNNLAKAGKVDMRPVFLPIGIGYRKEVNAIFEKQQPRGEGMRWPPLSPKYAAWKEKKFPGMPILVRTGKLKESMTQKGAEGNITMIGAISAVFGSSVPYGIYHDSDAPRKKIPRRNFSEPSERRIGIIRTQIEDYIPRRNFSEPSERRIGIIRTQIEDYITSVFERNGIKVSKGIFA